MGTCLYPRNVNAVYYCGVYLYGSQYLGRVAQTKWNVPYGLGLGISGTAFLAVITLTVLFISGSIESFVNGADIYTERLNDTLDWLLVRSQKYGINLNAQFLADTVAKLPVFTMVKSVGGTVVSILTNLMLIILFVIFCLWAKPPKTNPR